LLWISQLDIYFICVYNTLSNMINNKKYKFAVIATDIVIFTVENGELEILLIKMKKKPFTDCWAVPGGLVKPIESVDSAAERILSEKTGVKNVYLEQFYTFGDIDRDPFGRVVSVAYLALIPSRGLKLQTNSEYADVKWFPVDKLPKLAYDHKEMVNVAISKIQEMLERTNIAYSLLPEEFTLTELQSVYEIILKRDLDKRNFRKKIFLLDIMKKAGRKKQGRASRPAELYKFKDRELRQVNVL
jgi:8-oxo-dGTP diphosphatase